MSAISLSTTALAKSKAMSELNSPPMLSSVAPAVTPSKVFMPVSKPDWASLKWELVRPM